MAAVQIRVVQWSKPADTMSEKFRCLREDAGLTITQLAGKVGISRSCVHSLEVGQYSPSWETFVKLAKFFNVSLDWLAE